MTINHALFFTFNGAREGREARAMESFDALTGFWKKSREAGDIENFENVMLASTGNPNMPAGFMLITGERSKLQGIRWDNDEFLGLHTMAVTSLKGYACIDGYAGAGFDQHMQRLSTLMKE